MYVSFAIDVVANFNDKNRNMNSQIRTTISILDQQMLNLNAFLINKLTKNFKNQHQQTMRMKNKLNDFLKSKITFTMISVKRQKMLQFIAISDEFTKKSIFIDSRLLFFFTFSISFFFVSSSKKTVARQFKFTVETSISSFVVDVFIFSSVYQFNRNINIITNFFKK